jgi:hypothetical protein
LDWKIWIMKTSFKNEQTDPILRVPFFKTTTA